VVECTQNVHLVARWLNTLEKKLEQAAVEGSDELRVFISAEPAPTVESHIIPQGILESSIKITNEPPTGMHANLHKSLCNFNQVCLSPHRAVPCDALLGRIAFTQCVDADATYSGRCSVVRMCVSVCLLITSLSCDKTIETVEMPFWVWTRVEVRVPGEGAILGHLPAHIEGAIWGHCQACVEVQCAHTD